MPGISVIKKADDGRFYIRITRANGSTYRVLSEDRESIAEYQNELLQAMQARRQRAR